MIIYFCDRQLNILGQASTVLPAGNRVSQDKTVEDVETGVNSFECILTWDEATRQDLETAAKAGNYILKKGGFNGYDSLYQIIETEADTLEQEISIYAEDAGLDLINTLCEGVTLTNQNITQMLRYFLPSDWAINVQDAPTTTKTYTWDGTSTCTERIRSVVGLWDCELYYSFDIDKLQVKEKIVNVVKKRGLQEAIPQLRLNYDIDRIVTRTSIANLVTALNVTGGTPDGSEVPINLKGYSYRYEDLVTGDIYEVHTPTGQMRNITAMDRWSSAIDTDGLLVGSFSFDTTDKAVLAGQARAELQRLSAPAVNYEVDFATLPEDAQIGDRVNIIDDDGELYLEARLLLIETCEAEHTKKATIGEYLLKTSGISDRVIELAAEVKKQAENDEYYRDKIQILTQTVDSMLNLEVESNIVSGVAQLKAHLYNGDKEVTTEHSEALYKWILRKDTGERLLGRGYNINVDLEIMGYAGTILCRFIRPELYDLTDHNLAPITDQDGNVIQVSYAGVYSEPVVRRATKLRALNKASNTNTVLRATANETGYPVLAREVNLYERGNLDAELKNTLQYFWHEQSGIHAGVHITEVSKDDFISNPENAGGNLLAKSDGITIRDGLTELAEFGATGSRIGGTTGARVETSPTGVTIYSEMEGVRALIDANGLKVEDDNYIVGSAGRLQLGSTVEEDPDGTIRTGSVLVLRNMSNIGNSELKQSVLRSIDNAKKAEVVCDVRKNAAGTKSSSIRLRADAINSNVAIVIDSDRRLKDHIEYLGEDAAAFCSSLQPALYLRDGKKHLGFYAQDVRANDVWEADLAPLTQSGYLGLNYTELIAPLVAYCQTLEKRIKELEGKNG